jgi:hypothetical protein
MNDTIIAFDPIKFQENPPAQRDVAKRDGGFLIPRGTLVGTARK